MLNFLISNYTSIPIILICAVLLDLILGDPYYFPHPVRLMGKLITAEEKISRKMAKTGKSLKICGFLIAVFNTVAVYLLIFFLLNFLKKYKAVYFCLSVWICYTCIAARCLQKEAIKVIKALQKSPEEGRLQLSGIVGRDTKNLSEENIIKACIETVAENTSDGIIAPIFFIIVFGAAGGITYKIINTMDSMLGYKNEKYADLGFCAAKLDDAANYLPSRFCAILMLAGSLFYFDKRNSIKRGFKIWLRDKRNHLSPNSAQSESAAAGILGIRLGGPSFYGGKLIEKPFIGEQIHSIDTNSVKRCIRLMYAAEFLLITIYTVCAIFLPYFLKNGL